MIPISRINSIGGLDMKKSLVETSEKLSYLKWKSSDNSFH